MGPYFFIIMSYLDYKINNNKNAKFPNNII